MCVPAKKYWILISFFVTACLISPTPIASVSAFFLPSSSINIFQKKRRTNSKPLFWALSPMWYTSGGFRHFTGGIEENKRTTLYYRYTADIAGP